MGYCAAEAAHHGLTAMIEIFGALVTSASASQFVRMRAKRMEFLRTQKREKARRAELIAKAQARYNEREAEMEGLSIEELERRKKRRANRGSRVKNAIRQGRLSLT